MPTIVAHRAGNDPTTAVSATDRANMIELDVHVFRGRVELRHAKVLRPSSRLWEQWFLLPRNTRVSRIDEVLEALPKGTPLLLDLKCFTPKAARQIRDSVPAEFPLAVACRSWWVLSQFKDRSDTTRLRSCGTRWQLWLATRLPGLGARVGIVAHERLLTAATIQEVTSKTPLLYSWAIPSVERAIELALADVRGLIVDDLSLDWPGPNGPTTAS